MTKKKKSNWLIVSFLGILFFIGFFYRFYGLNDQHAFWTDETHVAIFTRAILEQGRPILANGHSTGFYQWLQYWLGAISAKIFGLNELALRFPSVIFGVLTIGVVYLLGKELFNKKIGLTAAVLTTFLKIEILWSRQARPYQALQFFYLLSAFFIDKLAKEKKFNWQYFLGFLSCGLFASLFHVLGLIIFFNGFFYLFLVRFDWFKKRIVLLGGLLALIFVYLFSQQLHLVYPALGRINNFFYYRVFLTHHYALLVFLALIGLSIEIYQKKVSWKILGLFLLVQILIVSFFLPKPFVRYFYLVFPFLILLSAAGLFEISRLINKKFSLLIMVALLSLIMLTGGQYSLLPQKIYSLNEDMQEIPEIDYKKIYAFIEKKLADNPGAIYISNWNDHPIWYLGEGELDYLLRKRLEPPFDKDPVSGAVYLKNLEELKSTKENHSQGLLLLESWDDFVPEDARQYVRQNLKKELEVDRLYPIQPRYWPVEIYSWGI